MRSQDRDELLTLQEAADRLKVHYMTAYRWVRRGELAAFKAGGRLRVRAGDLDRFVRERQVDVAMPSGVDGRTDWPVHVERLRELLRAGKGVEAGALVRKVMADGATAGDVYLSLLTPAMHGIGEDWAAGLIGVAEEHRATAIAATIMVRLNDAFRRRGPSRGTAVTLAAPGELHGLAAAMAADFLRAAGFDIHHLGVDVPLEELRRFLATTRPDVVCMSLTNPQTDAAFYREVVRMSEDAGTEQVVFGGQGADADAAVAAGGIYAAGLPELAEELLARRPVAVPTG